MLQHGLRLTGMGALEGKSWQGDLLLRVGRISGIEVELEDSSVSRRHAEMALTDQCWVVRDLGSRNGTFLNGLRVGRVNQRLQVGDRLMFGTVSMVVTRTNVPRTDVVAPSARPLAIHSESSSPPPKPGPAKATRVINRLQLDGLRRAQPQRAASIPGRAVYQEVLEEVADLLGADCAFLALAEAMQEKLVIRAEHHRSADVWAAPPAFLIPAQAAYCRRQSSIGTVASTAGVAAPGYVLCALVRTAERDLGVLVLGRSPARAPFHERDLTLAQALAAAAGNDLETIAGVARRQENLFLSAVIALAQAVELRDEYTGGHAQRVTDYALLLADELGVPPQLRYYLQIGTPLHDIGKMSVVEAGPQRPGEMTAAEYEARNGHFLRGASIIETIPELAPVLAIVRNNRERWDGKGHPDCLAGECIPLLARIVAVADAFDAWTSERPDRPALPVERAFQDLQSGAGAQFDPACVAAFLRLRPRIEQLVAESASDVLTVRHEEIARARRELSLPTR